MNPTVSIIVPVYNGELFLKRCVDSILKQDYKDFELLLADDGSTDGSAAICDEYAASDPRVLVIHKENSGVSDTRNRAMRHAKGRYLQFVDCDDWLTADATRLMTKAAMVEKPADFYYGVLWNKLFRRELVEKYHLYMDTGISWCEDFMFNLEYIRQAERFYVLRSPVYYYVKTKGSLASQGMSLSKTIQMKRMVFEYYNSFYKHVLEEEEYEKNRLQVYRFLVDAARDGIVPPVIFPGSVRLGKEQQCADKCLSDKNRKRGKRPLYRNRKKAYTKKQQ